MDETIRNTTLNRRVHTCFTCTRNRSTSNVRHLTHNIVSSCVVSLDPVTSLQSSQKDLLHRKFEFELPHPPLIRFGSLVVHFRVYFLLSHTHSLFRQVTRTVNVVLHCSLPLRHPLHLPPNLVRPRSSGVFL